MDKCPVDHSKLDRSAHPYFNRNESHPTSQPDAQSPASSSPTVPPGNQGDSLNSANFIPADLSQQTRHPQQTRDLPNDREHSTIPRSDPDQNNVWVYPSQQMFYNAMKRKNWDPKEKDMAVVVPIHNAVNEMAWKKILEWESYSNSQCTPQLTKFQGHPGKLSPRAWFNSTLLGYTRPFDRHDWQVNRCGTEINYVIDFYSGRMPRDEKNIPTGKPISFYLDVRPKLDSWDGIKLRCTKFWSDLVR